MGNGEVSNLKYQQSHDREQLNALKKRNDANESKISAYNASFIELAEKLKQLNDDTKAMRKENEKKKKKCDKLEKSKKKLKGQIKTLNEKKEYEQKMEVLNQRMNEQSRKKIESINKYNV